MRILEKTITFSRATLTGKEEKYVKEVVASGRLSGDNVFTKKCHNWIEERTKTRKALLTTSCTHALEMSSVLIGINPGDEVIMPSFTFPSTANSFILRGARIVFVDIRPDTMNIDEALIEKAISAKTKAIVPVHYAGVGCEMDSIIQIAKAFNLTVVEDAAQGMMSTYDGKMLGSIGDIGCYSFHETKNYQCGEGGAILLNFERLIERAEIIREKGTNRSQFFRGEIDKYSWQDIGSSYLPSDLNAAFLWAQLESAEDINTDRLKSWGIYYAALKGLEEKGFINLPHIPSKCKHNAHMFYIKTSNLDERTSLIDFLKSNEVYAVFHYVPLHSSKAGRKYGRFNGIDRFSTSESERLLRLPLYFGMTEEDIDTVCSLISKFYSR